MKKTLSLLLAFCLVFLALPTPAHAAASSVWVGGVKLTSGKYLASGRRTATSTKPSEGYAHYKNGVLYLNDYYYSGFGVGYYDPYDYYPYDASIYSDGSFSIKVTGDNYIANSAYEGDAITSADGSITISGTGSLELDAYYGIFLWDGNLTIKNATVKATGSRECLYCETGKLTISDSASVTVESYLQDGIYAHGDISISNSTVVSDGYYDGIYSDKNVNITDSTVTLWARSWDTSDVMQALYSEKNLKLSYTQGYLWTTDEYSSMTDSMDKAFKNSPRYRYIHIEPFTCEPRDDVERIKGKNRYDTSARISERSYEYADNVVIVSGTNYADGLAGVPLAYALDAPILLVSGDSLSAEVRAEINRLGAINAYIIGGKGAVSGSIAAQLKNMDLYVERIYGASRFETAVAIAEKLRELVGDPDEIFFAYSHNYPDALAISNIAAIKGCPILYVASSGKLDPATKEFVTGTDASSGVVLGGTGAIGPNAEANIRRCGIPSVERIKGKNRYETCLTINKLYSDYVNGAITCIATGLDYPDSLTGGVLAALYGSPLVLCGKSLTDSQIEYLSELEIGHYVIFGGTAAVNSRVESQLP